MELGDVLLRPGLLNGLLRTEAVHREAADPPRGVPQDPLAATGVRQRPVGHGNPQRHHDDDRPDHGDVGLTHPVGVVVAEDDVGEVVGSVHDEHQAHVNDGEAQVDEHADQVQGAGGLASTEHLGVPGEAPDDCRRHDRARHDHQRGGDEDDEEVPQLLKAVVGGEVAQGRGTQVRVGQ